MRTTTLDSLFTSVNSQTVSLMAGKASYPGNLTTYACLGVEAPFVRSTALNSGVRQGSFGSIPAGMYPHNGNFFGGNVAHRIGTVILLQVSGKRGGLPVRDGAIFVRLRTGAPLWAISGTVPTHFENTCGDRIQMFAGYADILNADELDLLGIRPNRSYIDKFMTEDEVAECFHLTMLSEETVPRPQLSVIATPTGNKLQEVAQEPERRLRFRRST